MQYNVRGNPWVKALAVLLSVVLGVTACFGWAYSVVNWDAFFNEGDYTGSPAWSAARSQYTDLLHQRIQYEQRLSQGESLSYLEQQDYNSVCSALDPENTNFRYTVRDNRTGQLLFSSSGEDSVAEVSQRYADMYAFALTPEELIVSIFAPSLTTVPVVEDEEGQASSEVWVQWAIEYGVDASLSVQDNFRAAKVNYQTGDPVWLYAVIALTLGYLVCVVFLLCCAGHRRGREEIVLNWQDQIPADLYLCALFCALVGLFALEFRLLEGLFFTYGWPQFLSDDIMLYLIFSALVLAGFFALAIALVMSVAARIKARTLLHNTLIWRVCAWGFRLCADLFQGLADFVGGLDVTFRVVVGFGGYLIVNAFLAAGLFLGYRSGNPFLCFLLLVLVNAVVLGLICRWTLQWYKVRVGAEAIVSGHPDTVIDTGQMQWFPSLRTHAEELNDLGSAINTAVDQRLKSERMKAELITNVSHDLKTPLTSIINYVDLLKKEDIQEEKAREYIEVLDRKSQRLKKLTEDLVEASKASTGALPVERERLGMVQLVNQALGEYAERLERASLTPVVSLPEGEAWVMADGRHMWRILDNLFGNCIKYAMPGTRVYLDVVVWDGYVTLSLKNISAQQLNVPAEQLMERFVRGDESRTTEGSGLGLSIARSLCELQGGHFRLEVDGDLFKAVVAFPLAD